MFEARISAGAKEKRPTRASVKPGVETISSWSYDMERHAKTCVDRYCELVNKKNSTKSLHHAWMTINSKNRKLVSSSIVYSLLTNCSQMSVFGSY